MSEETEAPIQGVLTQIEINQIKALVEVRRRRELELELAQARYDLEVERVERTLLQILARRGVWDIEGVSIDVATGHYRQGPSAD